MRQRIQHRALVAASLAAMLSVSTAAISLAGPLDSAPPVLQQKLLREGRFELAPRFGATVGDAFERHVLGELAFNYYPLDWLAIGADFGYAFSIESELHERIDSELSAKNSGVCPDIESEGYDVVDCRSKLGITSDMATSHIQIISTATVTLLPIVGKAMLFGEALLRYDLYLLAGVGVGTTGGDGVEGVTSLVPVAGIGAHLYINDWLAINVQARDLLIKYSIANDQSGRPLPNAYHNHVELSAGVSFLLPTVLSNTTGSR